MKISPEVMNVHLVIPFHASGTAERLPEACVPFSAKPGPQIAPQKSMKVQSVVLRLHVIIPLTFTWGKKLG